MEDSIETGSWRRVLIVIWFLIALEPVSGALLGLAVVSFPALVGKSWFLAAAVNAIAVFTFAVALLIAGREARKTIRQSITVPKYKWTGFALFFPIALEALLFFTQFGINGFHWAFRTEGVPVDELYVAKFTRSFLLLLLLPAFVEEALFRGLLQKLFIRRYGMYRGIFLVCIVWAAFHFHSDFASPHGSYQQVFYRLSGRIVASLGIGFVLSWLTLQSRTVVPATISHALYNTLVFSPPGFVFMGRSSLRTTHWAVAAIILFRFWQVPTEPSPEMIPSEDPSPQSESSRSGDGGSL